MTSRLTDEMVAPVPATDLGLKWEVKVVSGANEVAEHLAGVPAGSRNKKPRKTARYNLTGMRWQYDDYEPAKGVFHALIFFPDGGDVMVLPSYLASAWQSVAQSEREDTKTCFPYVLVMAATKPADGPEPVKLTQELIDDLTTWTNDAIMRIGPLYWRGN